MYRHLLVPLDGSPLAESALPAAVRIAGMFGAEVTLLHVLEVRPPSTVHGAKHLADAGAAVGQGEGAADAQLGLDDRLDVGLASGRAVRVALAVQTRR